MRSIQRFRVEAQAAASLKHPNIVSIYEIGCAAGQHYFSMEYVDGQNLAQLVRDKPLAPKKAAAYVKTIAEAIQSAHERGILHRDLKPSNVLIDTEDRVRITDFGLAKRLVVPPSGGPAPEPAEAGTTSELTLTGQVLGTPNYLSPEQALARKEVSAATDVYALGGILYYLLTARPPFQAATLAETLQQIVNAEPLPQSPRLRATSGFSRPRERTTRSSFGSASRESCCVRSRATNRPLGDDVFARWNIIGFGGRRACFKIGRARVARAIRASSP